MLLLLNAIGRYPPVETRQVSPPVYGVLVERDIERRRRRDEEEAVIIFTAILHRSVRANGRKNTTV